MARTAKARQGRARRHERALGLADPDWERHARCAGMPTDFFYSDDEGDRAYAKSICRRCPVEEDCLAHAVRNGELGGVWGGQTDSERVDLILRGRLYDVGAAPLGGDDGPAAA